MKRTNMVVTINNSTEWNKLESSLLHKSADLKHGREIKKMIKNIHSDVTKLSKEEVEQRRGRSNKVMALLEKVNTDIEMVTEYILVAALIG